MKTPILARMEYCVGRLRCSSRNAFFFSSFRSRFNPDDNFSFGQLYIKRFVAL